jgi:hypothetical protein
MMLLISMQLKMLIICKSLMMFRQLMSSVIYRQQKNVDNIPSAVNVEAAADKNIFRQGFRLNLMVVGEEGLGKASLVNSLFKANALSC